MIVGAAADQRVTMQMKNTSTLPMRLGCDMVRNWRHGPIMNAAAASAAMFPSVLAQATCSQPKKVHVGAVLLVDPEHRDLAAANHRHRQHKPERGKTQATQRAEEALRDRERGAATAFPQLLCVAAVPTL